MSRLSLLTKLLLAILLPMVLTFAGFGLFSHYAANRALLLQMSAWLIDMGREMFNQFAAAAAGVDENAVKAASLESLRGLTWLPNPVADAVYEKIHGPGTANATAG